MISAPPNPAVAQLRNFLRVCECGSFQLAATEAFRSQPAISKSIKALEEILGGSLFESEDRTALTPLGLQCEPLIRELLTQYDRSVGQMLALARGELGSVTIATVGGVSSHWLPGIVSNFMATHPSVRITLRDDNTRNIAQLVSSGVVDFGLCGVVDDPGLHFEGLLKDKFGLVCHQSHPLANASQLRWTSLRGLRLIRTAVHLHLPPCPESTLLAQTPLEAQNMMTLFALLAKNVGCTVLPEMAMPPMISGVRFIPLTHPVRFRELGLVQLRGRTLHPAANAMASAIRKVAKVYQQER